MRYSTRLSDAVHIMCYIALNQSADLSSAAIANSICTNPACVRQLMMKLRAADLMSSVHGHAKPSLTREPDKISLLEIYKAVEGDKPLLHLDTHINPLCDVGVNVQFALRHYYDRVQQSAEAEMDAIHLSDIIEKYNELLQNHSAIPDLAAQFLNTEE